MFQKNYEVPYGYRAKVGLIIVGPNLNPTPEISRMLPDYVQLRETRIHMDPVVNIQECSKLSGPLSQAAALVGEGLSSPLLGNRSAIAFACTAGSLVGGPGWDKNEVAMMEKATALYPSTRYQDGQLKAGLGLPCTTPPPPPKRPCAGWASRRSCGRPLHRGAERRFRVFYQNSGFDVRKVVGLGIEDLLEIGFTRPSQPTSRPAGGHPRLRRHLHHLHQLPLLRRHRGHRARHRQAVVTSNQATAWH